jgi:predicted nucleic-acid-binding protein
MIGLDTKVLARYYVVDDADVEAVRQRPLAQSLIDSDEQLFISKTVIRVEDSPTVAQALESHQNGVAFADALHHASYRTCDSMASFDDRKFARRIASLKLHPPVRILR